MDEEIRITPKVDTTQVDALARRIKAMADDMERMAQATQRIHLPTPPPGGHGWEVPGRAPGIPGGGGPPVPGGRAPQGGPPDLWGGDGGGGETGGGLPAPRAPRSVSRRSGAGQISSGKFLSDFETVIQPILPQLDQIMASGGGLSGVSKTVGRYHEALAAAGGRSMGASIQAQAVLEKMGIKGSAQSNAVQAYQQEWGALTPQDATRETMAAIQRGLGPSVTETGATPGAAPAGGSRWTAVHRTLNALGLRGASRALGRVTGTTADAAAAASGAAGDVAGGLAGGLASGLATAGVGMVGGAALAYLGGQGMQGWSSYMSQAPAFSALQKSVGTLGESFNTLRMTVNRSGWNFAESMSQMTQVAQTYSGAVGNIGTHGLSNALTNIQGFAFGYGLSPTQTAGQFGQAATMGLTFGHHAPLNPATFAAQVANATAAGRMPGRQAQVLQELLSLNQTLAQQTVTPPHPQLIANLATQLNQTGVPGLQGMNGAALLNTVSGGIQSPGAGSAGQLFMYQALNPGNKLSFWQEQVLQSYGIGGINPITHKSNAAAMIGAVKSQLLPGGFHGSLSGGQWNMNSQTSMAMDLLGQMLHLSPSQAAWYYTATQGAGANPQANATAGLARAIGGGNVTGTYTALDKRGAMGLFSSVANATRVGGPQGLAALAAQASKTLHGKLPSTWGHELAHYRQLQREHPTTTQGRQQLMHQETATRTAMQKTLGHALTSGPVLQTSMDKINANLTKAQVY